MLKILQATLQQYLKRELQYVQAGFRKGRGIRYQIGNLHWVIGKASEVQKNFYLFDYAKAFACVLSQETAKLLKSWEYPTTFPAFWETGVQVKKQQLEVDKEQQTGSKLGYGYTRLHIVNLII